MKQSPKPWGWIGFFAIILLLALVSIFALLRESRQLVMQQAPHEPLLSLVIAGRRITVTENEQQQLEQRLRQALPQQQKKTIKQLQAEISRRVDKAFRPVHQQVPAFADWYYSLSGEYLRYAHAIGGDMSEFLQHKVQKLVFKPTALEHSIDHLLPELDQYTRQLLHQSGIDLLTHVEAAKILDGAESRRPAHLIDTQVIDFDQLLSHSLSIGTDDINRQVVSVMAAMGTGVLIGKGVGALVVKKALLKIGSAKSFKVAAGLLTKLAAKSAIKGGSITGSAAASAALCSPSGPGALICGAVGGLVAWVVVDKIVIELDESLNRDAFEGDIHHAIQVQQNQLKSTLQAAYIQTITARFSKLEQRSSKPHQQPPRDYIPARAVTQKPTSG